MEIFRIVKTSLKVDNRPTSPRWQSPPLNGGTEPEFNRSDGEGDGKKWKKWAFRAHEVTHV